MELYPVGTKVRKISGKPFKSMRKANTVKAIEETVNPATGKRVMVYYFEEDESFVACDMCVKDCERNEYELKNK